MSFSWLEKNSKYKKKVNPETGKKETAYVSEKNPSKVLEYLGKNPTEKDKEHARKRVQWFKFKGKHPQKANKIMKKNKKAELLDMLTASHLSSKDLNKQLPPKLKLHVEKAHDDELMAEVKDRAQHGDEKAKQQLKTMIEELKGKKASDSLTQEDLKDFPSDAKKQFDLAKRYENGHGVERSPGSAYYYYRQAYKGGYTPALDAIKKLRFTYPVAGLFLGLLSKRASGNQDSVPLSWLGGIESVSGGADDIQGTAREQEPVQSEEDRLAAIKKEYEDLAQSSEDEVLKPHGASLSNGGVNTLIHKFANGLQKSEYSDPASTYNNGLLYWTNADKSKAIDCFIEASQKGHKIAQAILNKIREEGRY